MHCPFRKHQFWRKERQLGWSRKELKGSFLLFVHLIWIRGDKECELQYGEPVHWVYYGVPA